MYLTIAVVILTRIVRVELWKKVIAVSLTVPEHVGFAVWLTDDTKKNRHIYLYCQYFSFFSLIATSLYHFFTMLAEYILMHDSITSAELSVTGTSLVFYGVFGTFFLMSFQDYNALESQAEQKKSDSSVDGNDPK